MNKKTVCTIRKEAADLIETGGWIQHKMRSDGRYCMVGAIHATLSRRDYDNKPQSWRDDCDTVHQSIKNSIIRLYRSTIPEDFFRGDSTNLERWNDDSLTTVDQVLTVLRDC